MKTRQAARVRASAARAVDAVLSGGRSLDAALADAEDALPASEHALLRNLCYGTLRHYWQLAEWVDALVSKPLKARDSVVRALLLVGLFQVRHTRIPDYAVVSETVEAARLLRRPKLAGLINAVLRRFGREDLGSKAPASIEARYNHPMWLIERLQADWPDDWESILAANDERAPMWLRVNVATTTRDRYLATLTAAGIEAIPFDGLDEALRLQEPLPVSELPGFDDGQVSVQDGAAQLAAPWLLSRGHGRVLDACAAPGGKTAHLKELGGDEVALTAVDRDAERLAAVTGTLARLGLAATVLEGDASTPEEWSDGAAFDGILVDAPCSATGVIRRHPDIKHLRRDADIDALAALQAALLEGLWPLLVPGGRLLYVTCSVLAAENERTVARFLEAHSDAREDDMLHNNNIRDLMRRKPCGYQVLPGTHGMDGFYFACLQKVATG